MDRGKTMKGYQEMTPNFFGGRSLICQVPPAWAKKKKKIVSAYYHLFGKVSCSWDWRKKLTTPASYQVLLREFSTTEASIAQGRRYRGPASNTKKMSFMLAWGLFQEPGGPKAEGMSLRGFLVSCSSNSLSAKPVVFQLASSHRAALLKSISKGVNIARINQCHSRVFF